MVPSELPVFSVFIRISSSFFFFFSEAASNGDPNILMRNRFSLARKDKSDSCWHVAELGQYNVSTFKCRQFVEVN